MPEPAPKLLLLSETQKRSVDRNVCRTVFWLTQLPSFTFLTVAPDDDYDRQAQRMLAAGIDVHVVASGEWYNAWWHSAANPKWDGTPRRDPPDPERDWKIPIVLGE